MTAILEQEQLKFNTLEQLRVTLKERSCRKCDLGFQPNINGCCVARGPNDSKLMIIGEAPGKDEDATREPFTGPAGKLLDDIWKAAQLDTRDWYITNVVLCRPVAPKGSGKENLTPRQEQRKRCRLFLNQQIELLKPKIIVTLGLVATQAIVGPEVQRMGDARGQPLHFSLSVTGHGLTIFPMLHPAAILHASGDKVTYDLYRKQTWDDVRSLKKYLHALT